MKCLDVIFQKEMRTVREIFTDELRAWYRREYPKDRKGDMTAAARRLGYKSTSTFSNIVGGRRYVNEDDRPRIAKIAGIDYAGIVKRLTNGEPVNIDDAHVDIIKRFSDKTLAKKINSDLLEIEKMGREPFEDAAAHIKIILKRAKEKVGVGGADKKQGSSSRKEMRVG